MRRLVVCAIAAIFQALCWPVPASAQSARPTFRSAVDLVSVAAVVRDKRGQLVHDLSASDFVVVDGGETRRIVDFTAGSSSAVSLALLVDESGSMRASPATATARSVAGQFLDVIESSGRPGDAVGLFGFDTQVRELQAFTSDLAGVRAALAKIEPFGSTSIYDAIDETARLVAARGWVRRALVVVTDGMDNRSRLRLEDVSGIASAIDVPVYVVQVGSPTRSAFRPALGIPPPATLEDLARWTGGEALTVGGKSVDVKVAAARIVADVRFQYLLAFESAPEAGWRPLQVRMRDGRLSVRARAAYMAGPARDDLLVTGRLSGGR